MHVHNRKKQKYKKEKLPVILLPKAKQVSVLIFSIAFISMIATCMYMHIVYLIHIIYFNIWLSEININVFNLKDCFKIFTPLLYYTPQNFIVLDINFTMDLFQIKITTKYQTTWAEAATQAGLCRLQFCSTVNIMYIAYFFYHHVFSNLTHFVASLCGYMFAFTKIKYSPQNSQKWGIYIFVLEKT